MTDSPQVTGGMEERKECTAMTDHVNWCDCGRDTCWEEQLRLRVSFDNNQNRETCIRFIHRLMASALTHDRARLVEEVGRERAVHEHIIRIYGDNKEVYAYPKSWHEGNIQALSNVLDLLKDKGVE